MHQLAVVGRLHELITHHATALQPTPSVCRSPARPYPHAGGRNHSRQPTPSRSRRAATLLYEPARTTTRQSSCSGATPCYARPRGGRRGGDPSMACKGSGVQIPSAPLSISAGQTVLSPSITGPHGPPVRLSGHRTAPSRRRSPRRRSHRVLAQRDRRRPSLPPAAPWPAPRPPRSMRTFG